MMDKVHLPTLLHKVKDKNKKNNEKNNKDKINNAVSVN